MSAVIFDELERLRGSLDQATRDELDTYGRVGSHIVRIGEAFEALERAVVDAWPPEPEGTFKFQITEPIVERVHPPVSFQRLTEGIRILPEREPASLLCRCGERSAWLCSQIDCPSGSRPVPR